MEHAYLGLRPRTSSFDFVLGRPVDSGGFFDRRSNSFMATSRSENENESNNDSASFYKMTLARWPRSSQLWMIRTTMWLCAENLISANLGKHLPDGNCHCWLLHAKIIAADLEHSFSRHLTPWTKWTWSKTLWKTNEWNPVSSSWANALISTDPRMIWRHFQPV